MKLILAFIACLWCVDVRAEFRHFNEWTDKEKALFLGYNLVSYVDYSQTKSALSDPCDCYSEANPLFGKNPHRDTLLLTNVVVSGIAYYTIGKDIPDHFNTSMTTGIALRTYIVYSNHQTGISWRVAF